jgi:GntR family transcriptional regulator / MocR family aminotransferase
MLLSLDGQGPRYTQITRALVSQIQHGALAPGARAPSTRELARDTGCSRNVILLAYEQLLIEGYFVSRQRHGTFVAAGASGTTPLEPGARSPEPVTRAAGRGTDNPLSIQGRRLIAATGQALGNVPYHPGCPMDFMYGLCEPDERLVRAFRRALMQPLRDRAFSYASPLGDVDLREQIATRLRTARGISRPADHIVLTAGTHQALDICARLLLAPGDRVIMEDPGYEVATCAFEAAGARVVHVPVDRDGLEPARFPAARRPPRIAYVTPSHQFPTGVVMPVARRHALVEWARRTRAFVFEDDYDGEFRYAGQPIPALAGLDPHSVIYCGTFSKSLFPACRLGYLVLPPSLVDAALRCKWIADRGSSRLIERALAELLRSGDYDRHIRRMQRRYRERRDVLIRSLRHHFGPAAEIEGSSAGLHLIVWLPDLPPGRLHALVSRCLGEGIGIYPLAPHARRPLSRAALIFGYGIIEARDIDRGVQGVASAYATETGRQTAIRLVTRSEGP